MICSSSNLETELSVGKTLDNFFRARDIAKKYTSVDAIAASRRAYPRVNWRYFFEEDGKTRGM